MSSSTARAVNWVEQGLVPDRVVRMGIRRLLKERLDEVHANSQRRYIEEQAKARGLVNLQVITRDVSVELFEHLRNWPNIFARVAGWLKPEGRFFMHVFAHQGASYAFVECDASDWMSRHFFSGGMMPGDDLALNFQDDPRLMKRWRRAGTHYQKTSKAWLRNMDQSRDELMPLMVATYGDAADTWSACRPC